MAHQSYAFLVDVRTEQERKVAFDDPVDAINIPFPRSGIGSEELFILRVTSLHEINPQRPVILICREGVRSRWAAEALMRSGLPVVFTVMGGLEGDRGWLDSGMPVKE